MFGTSATSTTPAFGAQPTTSLFGQSTQQQQQPAAATQFGFGSTSATPAPAPVAAPPATTGLFGQSTAAPTPSAPTSTGGLFGSLNKPSAPTAAPTGSGFSFDTTPSTTPATTATTAIPTTTTTAPATAPAATGFSFGGSTAPTSTSTATSTTAVPSTAAAPMFKLGTPATTTAPSSTSTVPAVGTTLASAPSLSVPLSTTTPSSTTAPSSTAASLSPSTATSAPTSSAIQFPSTLKNKTIEEILTAWNEELENQVQEFQRQAVNLKEWDRKILSNAERVGKLNSRVSEMEQLQKNLEQGVNYVTMQQAELESLLDAIDRELPKMVSALGKTPLVGADADRSKTFDLAESLQIQLNDISSQLVRLVNHVNTSSNPKSQEPAVVTNVAQILNNHFETLQWIEEQVSSLQRNSLETQKLCDRAHAEHERLSLTKNY